MKPFERIENLGRQVRGWIPREPASASPPTVQRPWWWQPTWSMGLFVAEASLLNLIVPLSTLGLPLFLANMWLCFLVGGLSAHVIGKRRNYQSFPPSPAWNTSMRRIVILPAAVVDITIGVVYFSANNWVYVFTRCWTGNACTFYQLAPVFFLIFGAIGLVGLAIQVIIERL